MSEGAESLPPAQKNLRGLCVRWLAEVFYDSNRGVVCVRTRRLVPESEIQEMLRTAYAAISSEASRCLILPKSVIEQDLFVSLDYIRSMPRTHLFYSARSEMCLHHPYVYEAQAWTPKNRVACVRGQWLIYRENNRVARISCNYIEDILSGDYELDTPRRVPIQSEMAETIRKSAALGLIDDSSSFLIPIFLKTKFLRSCPFETWLTIRLEPTFDNSPSLARSITNVIEFPSKIESFDRGISYMSSCKHTEMRAIRERRFTFTVDMGGDGSKSDRIRKKYMLTDLAGLRHVFEERVCNLLWAHGEYTGRYIYEYIITERASRLYFDLDYDTHGKPTAYTGDEITASAIRAIVEMAQRVFRFEVKPTDVLVTECDRPDKISRHLIVRSVVFETVVDVGLFVGIVREHVLAHADRFPELIKNDGVCIIDDSVYHSGCQSFRPVGCSKAPPTKNGTPQYLRIAKMNQCPLPPQATDFDLMVFSLTQCVTFEESPPSERFYFEPVDHSTFVAVHRDSRINVEIEEPNGKKRKRPESDKTTIRIMRPLRVLHENEIAIGVAEKRVVFEQLVAWLPPQWALQSSHFEKFDVRMLRNEIGELYFAVLGKKGAKSYCAILAEMKKEKGITNPAQHCHRNSGVQFYIKLRNGRFWVTQRCKFRCGSDTSILACVHPSSDVLSGIMTNYNLSIAT